MFVPANFVILWIFIDEIIGRFPETNISETDAFGMRFFAIAVVFRKRGRFSVYLLNNEVSLEYPFFPVRTLFARQESGIAEAERWI